MGCEVVDAHAEQALLVAAKKPAGGGVGVDISAFVIDQQHWRCGSYKESPKKLG